MQMAADDLIGSLEDAKIEAEQRLLKMRAAETPTAETDNDPVTPAPIPVPTPEPSPEPAKKDAQVANRPLIFFHFPISGYTDLPAWINPLREALMKAGYMVYLPEVSLSGQLSEQDLPYLGQLPKRLVPALCRALKVPEELGMPFDHPATIAQMKNSETGQDFESIIFKDLWFLSRSSVVLVDLVREPRGVGFGQKMLYSKILDIPVIGISSINGSLNPWVQRSLSVLFTDQFNLNNIMPLIRGYAPLT